MSREVEVDVAGAGGRYKSSPKAPLILKPCEHLVERTGWLKKKLILVHGGTNGSTKVRRIKV